MLHQLTLRVSDRIQSNKFDDIALVYLDTEIKNFLSEKAQEIEQLISFCDKDSLREILGLESKQEIYICDEHHITGRGACPKCATPQVEKKSEGWCGHTKALPGGFVLVEHDGDLAIDDNWKFCPICGAKRPQEKTLAEKLREAIVDYAVHLENKIYCSYANVRYEERGTSLDKTIDALEKIATEHFAALKGTQRGEA